MKLLQAITPVAMKITPATMKTNASTTSAALEVSRRETMFLIGPSSTRPPIAITANDAPHRMTGVGRIVTAAASLRICSYRRHGVLSTSASDRLVVVFARRVRSADRLRFVPATDRGRVRAHTSKEENMIGGRRALLYVVGVLVIFLLVGVCSTNNGGKKVAFNVTVTDIEQGAAPGESLH
jgi:hypothetical protein